MYLQKHLHVSAKKYSHHQVVYKNKNEVFAVYKCETSKTLQIYCQKNTLTQGKQPWEHTFFKQYIKLNTSLFKTITTKRK